MDANVAVSDSFTAGCTAPEKHAQCSCCNEWDSIENNIIKCSECSRTYHSYCHIPIPIHYSYVKNYWKCTMCKDVNIYVNDLKCVRGQIDINDISAGTTCRQIVERLLMELYCDRDRTDHLRCIPNPFTFPEYYIKVKDAKSLNDIRTSIKTVEGYSLLQFFKDVYEVLTNVISFYPKNHSYSKAGEELMMFVKNKQESWFHITSLEDLEESKK